MTVEESFQLVARSLSQRAASSLGAGITGSTGTLGLLQKDFNVAFQTWRSGGGVTAFKKLVPVLKTYDILSEVDYDRINETLEAN